SSINKKHSVELNTEQQKYFLPVTLDAALKLKSDKTSSLLINGATDVALRVTKKHELLKEIIDLSLVPELKIFSSNKNGCFIGAGLSLEEAKEKTKEFFPALHHMLEVLG